VTLLPLYALCIAHTPKQIKALTVLYCKCFCSVSH